MNEHLTPGDLIAFLHGRLPENRVSGIAQHLARCPECSGMARGSEPAARAVEGLARQLAVGRAEHPPVETTLTDYVDGTLPPEDAAMAEAHLEVCARCRQDVDDLRAIASALRQRPRRAWLGGTVAAAALLALVAALLLFRREPGRPALPQVTATVTQPATRTAPPSPVPLPSQYERAEWHTAVDEALRTGALPMPAVLAGLRAAPDVFRTPSTPSQAEGTLQPVRTIVETTRPRFTWTPAGGATYLVSVFDGETLIAQSGDVSGPAWQPEHDLPRGRTYQWEVEVHAGDGVRMLPAPPAPPPSFRVLDAAAHADLQHARAAHGGDPLLLGVLYARSGLREDAERELRRVGTEQGQRLLRSVEQWPR